ncbi:acetylornithine deacetylase [Gracilibacillus halophilus YIM-C55.5]|uniref:Acetylornithine deacetylase n=1 Tax=Gracilibacillus halophilus YIM-C55.5 TaxID=1308866 RepID=N4WN89_9BACI|nr:acetylornithine deacetylase [Gracilibacillus halophilus]ENH95965.1 acetylornithine deacetylase [Gracilibacillus halophilus YIM-C55.5]
MTKDLERLLEKIENRQDELVNLLETLIRHPTPAPPARNTAPAQQYIASMLQDCGCEVDQWDVYPNDPNVVGTLKGSDSQNYQSLIINGHMDVAEVNDHEEWVTGDPFTPLRRNGNVIGRGAADMKGGLAGALFALGLIHESGLRLPGDVIFQSVIGEEVGEAGTLQCCKRGYTADFALVVDTSNLHIQGQGGVITGWITVNSPQTFHDATRREMIHAGGQLFGASAIEKMTKIIQGLQELERHWSVMKNYPGYPPGTNTINPAVIEGGRHAAFIADECRLWITVHYYPNETYESVIQEIETHLQAVAEADPWLKEHPPQFKWGGSSMIEDRGEIFPALKVDPNHSAVHTLRHAHQQVLKEQAVLDVSPSVTDGGWFSEAGIPASIYGPGHIHDAHSVNEKVNIKQLIDYTKVLVTFMYQWTHEKKQ